MRVTRPTISTQELMVITRTYKSSNNKRNITLSHKGFNSKGEAVFSVYQFGVFKENHTLVKKDLSCYNDLSILNIPTKISPSIFSNNKAYVVNWINRQTGLGILENDIDRLVVVKDKVTVIINPSSNRFYNNLTFKIV